MAQAISCPWSLLLTEAQVCTKALVMLHTTRRCSLLCGLSRAISLNCPLVPLISILSCPHNDTTASKTRNDSKVPTCYLRFRMHRPRLSLFPAGLIPTSAVGCSRPLQNDVETPTLSAQTCGPRAQLPAPSWSEVHRVKLSRRSCMISVESL